MADIYANLSPDSKSDPKNSTIANREQQRPKASDLSVDKGKDGYPHTRVSPSDAAAPHRLTRNRLLELEQILSDIDWEILKTLRLCRVALGKQICRLYFPNGKTPRANTTATNRKLKSLMDMGLITAMNQKINCRLKGYVAYIYYLTEAGERILQLHNNEPEFRKRNLEPAVATLTHTLSAVECYVQTVEACRANDMRLDEIKLEPDCWEPYQYNLKDYVLKPDLSLVTEKREYTPDDKVSWYELRWFVEVDLNTENIQTILEKCRRYYDYYRTDKEQQLHDDVFPLVVWIVKNESRRQSLIKHIRDTFPKYPPIFTVILPDEYTKLIRDELEMEELICPL